jgi:hypothetical protein
MRNWDALRHRFLQDRFAIQLGNIAANMGRIDSYMTDPISEEIIISVLDETKHFVSWAILNATLQEQLELAVLQQRLIQWQLTLPDLWQDSHQRLATGREARRWSDQLLIMSGLLDEDPLLTTNHVPKPPASLVATIA